MLSLLIQKIFSRFLWASLFCFLGGSLSALAMAPYNIWPILILGFGILYIALDHSQTKKQAFVLGWLFGFGYFVFGLYWIGNALLVEGNPYQWVWPLAVCGLPALLAFFPAASCTVVKRFCNLKSWHGYIGFVVLMSVSEWLRGHVFTGFPWNLYGYTWADMLPIMQVASLGGIYGLSAITLFWAASLGFMRASQTRQDCVFIALAVFVTFAAAYAFGAVRLGNAHIEYHDNIAIRIIQPNTPQDEKWQRDKKVGHFETALNLSRPKNGEAETPTIIIWPETAISPAFLNDPYARGKITDMLSEYHAEAELVTGALRYQSDSKTYHNSMLTIKQDGQIHNVYDKSHLVPFGEYIPFQKFIPLAPVVQFSGFRAGQGVQAFPTLENRQYSAAICYEIIFPGEIVPADKRPDFIVNVTNDAWYGRSPGPYQHFAITRFRAIEEKIPVIRAANTGISGLIDPYGRVINASQIFEIDSLFVSLPRKIASKKKKP